MPDLHWITRHDLVVAMSSAAATPPGTSFSITLATAGPITGYYAGGTIAAGNWAYWNSIDNWANVATHAATPTFNFSETPERFELWSGASSSGGPGAGSVLLAYVYPASGVYYPPTYPYKELLLSCEPVENSIRVYLNGVPQDPADWDLMPPDGTHAAWWVKLLPSSGFQYGDRFEARYACKPGV